MICLIFPILRGKLQVPELDVSELTQRQKEELPFLSLRDVECGQYACMRVSMATVIIPNLFFHDDFKIMRSMYHQVTCPNVWLRQSLDGLDDQEMDAVPPPYRAPTHGGGARLHTGRLR